ncbi:hypothetical protein Adt_20497 [Abeliophyllum distichum]|uniref:Uncharacterized protein n=1 Tax=Abeliophyllum distichum TaxID=126358 RepID=A0ABD1SWQ8_9LAMI
MMQSCNPRAHRSAAESKPPKFNAIMINCSRLITTFEETRDRQSPIVLQHVEHHLMHVLPKGLSHWDSATLQLAPPMQHSFVQVPLLLGLDHLVACSSRGAQLRSRASPTRTRPPCSLLLPWSTALLKGLSHWDSATLQLAPPIEHSFVQVSPILELGIP